MNTEQAIREVKSCPVLSCNLVCEFLGRENGCGYCNMPECRDIILSALRAQQERENSKPLTLEELRERVGMPVWISKGKEWAILDHGYSELTGSEYFSLITKDGEMYFHYINMPTKNNFISMGLYDHQPKE